MKKKTAKQQDSTTEPQADENAKTVACARARYLRISPQKIRLVLNGVRFKPVHEAQAILSMTTRKGARLAEKLLKSAIANAKVLELDEDRLYISDFRADGGPTFKRFRPRSMGRADRILKRTTHLSIQIKESDRQLRKSKETKAQAEEKNKTKGGKKKVVRKKRAAASSK